MFYSLCQGIRAVAVLASSRAGESTLMTVVALMVVLLIIIVARTAIWSRDPQRRKDALAVLGALLRWKGR